MYLLRCLFFLFSSESRSSNVEVWWLVDEDQRRFLLFCHPVHIQQQEGKEGKAGKLGRAELSLRWLLGVVRRSSGNALIQQPRWFGRRSIIKPENYVGRENNTSHALTAAAADILWNSKRTKLVGLMSIRGFSLSCTRHSSLSVESIPLFQRRRRRRRGGCGGRGEAGWLGGCWRIHPSKL